MTELIGMTGLTASTDKTARADKSAPAGGAERWYRQVMRLYPADYRSQFADEMLEILMQTDDPADRPTRASAGETWALLRHGLQMRLTRRAPRGTWSRPGSAGAAVLAAIVAVIGAQTLISSGFGYLTTDTPDRSTAIDSLWGAATLSLLTVGLLLFRRAVPAAISAWATVAAGVWASRSAFSGLADWGPLPESSDYLDVASPNAQAVQIALLVPSLVLALLLLRPGIGSRAVDVIGRRTLLQALAAGTLTVIWTEFGMSSIWAPMVTGAVLLVALLREGVVLRAGLLVAFAFGYLMLAGQADGSGSRLPRSGLPLTISLGVIPILAFLVGVLVISQIHTGTRVRDAVGRWLETFGRSVAAREPVREA
ncbi:MAG TPA: hypothetical protein VLL08_00195 [Kineosporiaceae bacterium]|nr:hypothetical protein [Kineosporiaceae bacterium]